MQSVSFQQSQGNKSFSFCIRYTNMSTCSTQFGPHSHYTEDIGLNVNAVVNAKRKL